MKRLVCPAYPLLLLLAVLFASACSLSRPGDRADKATVQWFEEKHWLNGLSLKPHQTIDRQEFRRQYEANREGWDKAFAFLKESNLAALQPGRHPIDGDNVYVLVTEGPGKDPEKAAWEGHQLYNDIHYVVSGKEKIGLAPIAAATLTTPYDPARDIAFYTSKGSFHEAGTDTFFIIFPQEAHCPGIRVAGVDVVKKVVVKVRRAA